jgi:hypothetical protein
LLFTQLPQLLPLDEHVFVPEQPLESVQDAVLLGEQALQTPPLQPYAQLTPQQELLFTQLPQLLPLDEHVFVPEQPLESVHDAVLLGEQALQTPPLHPYAQLTPQQLLFL